MTEDIHRLLESFEALPDAEKQAAVTQILHRTFWPARRSEVSCSPPVRYDHHCFISYTTREDEIRSIKSFIDRYIGELHALGVRHSCVWYDGFYLRDARYEEGELERRLSFGVAGSAFTVSFVSPGYLTSGWCFYEWCMTRLFHGARGDPAPGASILPIIWKKPDGSCETDGAIALFSDLVRRAHHLDISESLRSDPLGALSMCVNATLSFLDSWFPEDGWRLKSKATGALRSSLG
jgi:hypothetical protein